MHSYGRRHPTPILIISYETLRSHIDHLQKGSIGIMFCDEVEYVVTCVLLITICMHVHSMTTWLITNKV